MYGTGGEGPEVRTNWVEAVDATQKYALHGIENTIVIGQFFKQSFTVSTIVGTSELMSKDHDSITVDLSSTIQFASTNAVESYNSYSNNRSLFQCFSIYLKEGTAESETSRSFENGATLIFNGTETALSSSEYIHWMPFNEIKSGDWPTGEGLPSVTKHAQITLKYTPQGILDQFPTREDEKRYGIQINASSSISMDESALERSNLRVSKFDANKLRFYRDVISVATLSYNAYDQAQSNPQDSGLGNLGINGRLQTNGIIDSAALYNCSQVVGAQNATQLKLTLELMQKRGSDGTLVYNPVGISNYMNGITISAQVIGGRGTITGNGPVSGGVATLRLQDYDGHSPIKIDVKLDVKTGTDAEALTDFQYANYRVKLIAELCYANGSTISGSKADDYIVYTNAKIINSLITTS